MKRIYESRIYWLSETEGGRKEIPTGDKYAPIIKIKNPLFESDDFWSVFVINKVVLDKNETLANMEYLSDIAPNNLAKGIEFALYEGPKMVAQGTVLREFIG